MLGGRVSRGGVRECRSRFLKTGDGAQAGIVAGCLAGNLKAGPALLWKVPIAGTEMAATDVRGLEGKKCNYRTTRT
jgi:hypothetical protein